MCGMTDALHLKQVEALRGKTFTALKIQRVGDQCFLVIDLDGEQHVHVHGTGTPAAFGRVKPIKDWLQAFGIDTSSIEYSDVRW
jgi:hypothetical protein